GALLLRVLGRRPAAPALGRCLGLGGRVVGRVVRGRGVAVRGRLAAPAAALRLRRLLGLRRRLGFGIGGLPLRRLGRAFLRLLGRAGRAALLLAPPAPRAAQI